MSAEGRSRGPESCSGMRPPVALGGRPGMAPDSDGMSEAAASRIKRPRWGSVPERGRRLNIPK